MKISISKNAKRALSLVLAFAMLIGSLFVANVGVTIKADAADSIDLTNKNIIYWDDDDTEVTTFASGWTIEDGTYIIETAAQLNYVCTVANAVNATDTSTFGKNFKISDDIDYIILQDEEKIKALGGPEVVIGLSSAEETREFFEEKYAEKGWKPRNWVYKACNVFSGNFDGSGVGIYGLYADGTSDTGVLRDNVALFPALDGGTTKRGTYTATITSYSVDAGKTTTTTTVEVRNYKDDGTYEVVETTSTEAAYASGDESKKTTTTSSNLVSYPDTDGITIENLVLKNSYFKGTRRVGAIAGGAWYHTSSGTIMVEGCSNLVSSVVANCYLYGQNKYTSGGNTYLRDGNKTYDATTGITPYKNEMGVIGGGMDNDPMKISNCLVYGNQVDYGFYTATAVTQSANYLVVVNDTTTITGPVSSSHNVLFSANGASTSKINYGSITDSVILDAKVSGFTNGANYCTDVYTNVTPQYTAYDITSIIDHETTKGATGMVWMSGLDWTSSWYAVDGKYPSPIKPEGWIENPSTEDMTRFEGGDGSETNPYTIRTADQLKYMLDNDASSIEVDGTRYYYTVADGVDSIYINKATNKSEVETLVATGTYYDWSTAKAFNGDFDGKGVNIYGMISTGTNPGFITEFGVAGSIKNINFLGAYVTGSRAAVVTTNCSSWSTTDGYQLKSYITSVSVRESYIAATDSSGDGAGKPTAAGILSVGTPDHVIVKNCLYDGYSSELIDGDAGNGANASSSKAGIASLYGSGASSEIDTAVGGSSNEVEVIDCVSINEYPVSLDSDVWYYRYQAGATSGFVFQNIYGVYKLNEDGNPSNTGTYPTYFEEYYTRFVGCGHIDTKDVYTVADMPTLNWGAWTLVTLDDGRTIPMPKTSDEIVDSFTTQIANQNGGQGANGSGAFAKGTYGMQHTLTGSGTADDPYLISTALELARAIASGGTAIGQQLHYKLTQDVDLGGVSWINQGTIGSLYTYVPFAGVLDGDGHTVYNATIGDVSSAGLIPVLNGGTVTNLHLRYSTVASFDKAGAIVGTVISGTIANCSAEGCTIVNATDDGGLYDTAEGYEEPTVTNSYYYNSDKDYKYYDAKGAIDGMPTVDYNGKNADTAVWYKGYANNPRLVCRAKAMAIVDVAGDNDGDNHDYDQYLPTDLTALQNSLLKVDGYANVYGDVSRNGKTNISDLAILARHIAGSYNKLPDGFWRNAEIGNVVIYYGENDNYDAARKVELHLEAMTGADIKKVVVTDGTVSYGDLTGGTYVHDGNILITSTATYVADQTVAKGYYDFADEDTKAECTAKYGTAEQYALDGKLQIVVGDIAGYDNKYTATDLGENEYAVTYDKANGAVWIKGENFTAVEQAAIEFINGSDSTKADSVYSCDVSNLSDIAPEKVPVEIEGIEEKYYYAWGDEFNGDNIDTSIWYNSKMNTETAKGTDGSYNNVETADLEELKDIYTITDDGKLSIKRGVRENALTTTDLRTKAENLGYVILKNKSGTTVFNDSIEEDDYYVNAGSINTKKSLLFKQGYLEMKGSLPSDGHVFASWWMYGHLNDTNYGYSQNLYGKVFKLNPLYDGTSDTLDSTDLTTFKYQVPSSSFEIDIWELMQHVQRLQDYSSYVTIDNGDRIDRVKGVYVNEISLNIHKYYDVGHGDDLVNVINWANPNTPLGTITYTEITSDDNKEGWQYSTSAGEKDFGYTTASWSSYVPTYNYDDNYQKLLTANRRYGFYWWSDETNFTFTTYIYDIDGDGTEEGDTDMVTITQSSKISKMTYNEDDQTNAGLISDAVTANQYMYYIFDNIFYSSNQYNTNNGIATMFDLIDGGEGTTSLDIDYVRVYQLDGKRDIVTSETEDFNNGNHFGY